MKHVLDFLSGTVEITGEHDSGKSLLAFQAMRDPSKFAFLDADTKGRELVDSIQAQTKLGYYYDVVSRRGSTPLPKQYPLILNAINAIPNDMEVIVFDNWKVVYDTARAHITANRSDYGDNNFWKGDSEIIQGLTSKVARREEERLINLLRGKARLVLITSHLTDQYLNKKKTGVQVSDTSATFDQICYLRLRLRHNPTNSPVPVALVMKRFSKPVFEGGVFDYVNVLPPKLTPRSGEKSIWHVIGRYWNDPVGDRELTQDETPTLEEVAMMRGELTPLQRESWMAQLRADANTTQTVTLETADLAPSLPPLEEKVKELLGNGLKTIGEIMPKLQDAGYKVPPPTVMAILKTLGG